MSIILNGTTISDIIFNGVSLDKVIYNGVEVFTKAPVIIREPESGEIYNDGSGYYWLADLSYKNGSKIVWNGIQIANKLHYSTTVYNDGTWTYYRNSLFKRISLYKNDNNSGYLYGMYRIKN